MEELTSAQKSVWVTEQYYKGSSVNNICGTAIIEENVDFTKLEQAIKLVCKKHSNFKLRMKIQEENIMQELSENIDCKIDFINVLNFDELNQKRDKIVRTPFNIENNYLFKFYIFKFKNGQGAFMLNIHHLISDGWTLAFICNEIIKTYSALKQNQEIETESQYSYIDFINSEKEYIKSEKFQKDRAYWIEQFHTIPEVAIIPGSKENSSKEISAEGNRTIYQVDKEFVEKLKKYCKVNKISLYNFFMAIYGIYISEITNLDEFVIGTPILNRTNYKEKNAAGMFINMEPFKINLEGIEDFKAFVKNISIDSLNMLKHQKYSYQNLLEELREKDKNVPNLYNILLSYQITNAQTTEGNIKYKTEWTFNGCCADDIDIQIYDINDTGNLNISYDYKTSLYTERDMEGIHKRIMYIMQQVISEEDIKIKDIEIVTPEEKEKLVYEFNKTDLEYDKNIPIIKYFEQQVEKTPDNIAIVFEKQTMTYKELNEKANSLAYELRKNGVTNNTIVGIMVNRSFEMMIAILAVLKSGGCYIPIAPDYPDERIKYMLSDSNSEILLTSKKQMQRIKTNKKIINIELSDNKIYDENKENLKNISNPEDLSYMIYTSGSTGIPKGVMLKQKNLSNFYNAMKEQIDYLKDNKQHKIISITTVSFDIFIFETIMSLTRGLTLYMTNENEQKSTIELEKIIKENQIEILQTTPSVMKTHLENQTDIDSFKCLKYIILAGESLSEKLVEELKNRIPGLNIYNGYGPSETTIFSAIRNVTELNKITIGKPISNTQIYILNKNKKLLPQGMIGEIYISGDSIGKGYMNKKEQTEKSYLKNPFKDNEIMYKTGDLGAFDNASEISCFGRVDNQIKIRGLRIELSEIENQMLSIYNIVDCMVVKKQVNERETLCAYYTQKGPVDENTIKTVLQNKLPQYMLPQYFINMKSMPHTPNGKIDKKALPMPTIKEKIYKEIKPSNEIEKELAQIVKKILNLENVSMSDTLLDLGGDSLTAITVSTKILSKFNVQIYIKDILSNNTLKDIANCIIEKQEKNDNIRKMKKASKQEFYPLSSAQKRIYYNAQMIGEDNVVYNMPGGILVEEKLDKEKVQKVFEKIIERHETLRTSFVIKDTEVMQKIEEKIDFEIPVYENTEKEIKQIVKEFSKPFILEDAPLIRVEMHYIDDKKTLVLVDAHHIIMDGIGLNNLIIEFNRLYNEKNLKKLPIQYKDYAVWENEYNKNKQIKECEQYWVNKFKKSEIPQLNLPYDYKIPVNRSYKGEKISKELDEKEFRKIERFAKKTGVSPYVFFISAFFVLLYKYTGQSEIILGSPIANRDINEIKRLIGMFVNNIVIDGKIDSEKTFGQFLEEIKEQVLEDLSHQPYPFDMLVKKLNIQVDNSRNPLFDVLFTYQNKEEKIVKTGNLNSEIVEINNNIAKFNLSLEIKPGTHTINIEYRTDLFKKKTIERLYEHYMNTLISVINNKDIKIKDISIISEEEKNKILYEFNDTKTDYPENKTIVQLFENCVEKNKNSIAVKYKDMQITYDELDKKSNFIAKKLLEKGIKQGDVIGIYLNRSIELIISIMATLKVGAIYMPMYIKYPKERLEYMLNNSNAKLIIYKDLNNLDFNSEKERIEDFEKIEEYEEMIKSKELTCNNIAYMIYTSGSTGKPKGVQIKHKNVVNFIYAFCKYYNNEISSRDNFLASTNISFDVSIWEIFLPLLNGATLVLYDEEIIQDIFLYVESIIKNKITGLYIPPNILKDVYNIIKDKQDVMINKILVGVEPIRKSVLNKYYDLNENMIIINGYGPTETTICCTALEYKKDLKDGIVSIGRPLKNDNIYILSQDENIQPIGIPGEIYVTGDGVGAGYINNVIETEKHFLKNTLDKNNEKMYKTGDIAKWNEDGTITFIGRNDSQVKISGHRIELNEINHTIMEYPGIIKSYTTIYQKGKKSYIVTYYTAEKEIAISDLIALLKEKLANYMVPNFIMQLKQFPLTPNGKIDKEKLPTDFSSKVEYAEPRNQFENTVAEIFKKLFLLKKVGIDDNFFELGGDSLTAIKFQIEALNAGLKLTYSDIFSYPTIRKLSERKESKITYKIDENYDYTEINKILEQNNINKIEKSKKYSKANNVLLIGATGFLGAHILEQLLLSGVNKIYCIVRMKSSIEPEVRLKKNMEFYFGNKYNDLLGKKIIVIDGDITNRLLGQKNKEEYEILANNIDCVIHSAAIVKHYGNYKIFKDINIEGTNNVIEFCKKFKKKMYYISTLSISGNIINDNTNKTNIEFKENEFYVGQDLNNVYIYTKFEAEKKIFENIQEGLDACVLRIGNITNRYSDGKFQINLSENAFINRIKAIIKLGVIQEKYLEHSLEFTPVDCCSNAIVRIVNDNPDFTVLHLFNNNFISIENLLKILYNMDEKINPVTDEEFKEKVKLAIKDPKMKNEINGIITDLDENKLLNLINNIIPNSEFTQKYLLALGFKWPKIDEEYIKKYIEYFKGKKYI